MTEITDKQLLDMLHEEFKPALGCTEPVACAYACAKCKDLLGDIPEKIEMLVSGNIYKNGMGVGIPGTGMVGLHIASAMGAICGKSEYGLEVLKDVNGDNLPEGKNMLDNNIVEVKLKESAPDKLYVEAICKLNGEVARVVIQGGHTNIVLVEKNGETIFKDDISEKKNNGKEKAKLSVKRIWNFINNVAIEEIEFLRGGIDMNNNISQAGFDNEYGLQVGLSVMKQIEKGILLNDMLNWCLAKTCAASDARMDGCPLPVMTNSGSGNLGITTYLPVVAAGEKLGSSEEKVLRGVALSNLLTRHITSHMGHLSALCKVMLAGAASGCAIVYLLGGDYNKLVNTIKTMGSNLTGMMCDGAKQGCALKVYSAVAAGVQAALLADSGIITRNDGIIEEDIEKTIQNICRIGSEGMIETDNMILDIMTKKK